MSLQHVRSCEGVPRGVRGAARARAESENATAARRSLSLFGAPFGALLNRDRAQFRHPGVGGRPLPSFLGAWAPWAGVPSPFRVPFSPAVAVHSSPLPSRTASASASSPLHSPSHVHPLHARGPLHRRGGRVLQGGGVLQEGKGGREEERREKRVRGGWGGGVRPSPGVLSLPGTAATLFPPCFTPIMLGVSWPRSPGGGKWQLRGEAGGVKAARDRQSVPWSGGQPTRSLHPQPPLSPSPLS